MPSNLRSDRARRRAAQLRNRRIALGVFVLLVLLGAGYFAYTAFAPGSSDGAATATTAAVSGDNPAAYNEADLTTMASGLKYQDLTVGTGAEAGPGQTVTVHYTGWLTDGTKFDSSVDKNSPFSFQLGTGNVITGWDEGVAGMKVGGKRRLVIPPELGYGPNDYGPIPGNSTLVFDVELLDVQ